MRTIWKKLGGVGMALLLGSAVGGCDKLKQKVPQNAGIGGTEAKRHQAACASPKAYDRVKGVIFDQAIEQRNGDRNNLDALADYSQARMEHPIVDGWDPALDVTRCRGRFILDVPPGAERGMMGDRHLQAEIKFTAQAAADGSGLVYTVEGAQPMVARLARFNVPGVAYRPPPAIDEAATPEVGPAPVTIAQSVTPRTPRAFPTRSASANQERPMPPAPRQSVVPGPAPELASATSRQKSSPSVGAATGEGAVRAFYSALGAGNGAAASARMIPEKRSSRAFSPDAISRFYGGLPEPIKLTGIVPLTANSYRVKYHYSAGRSHCNGSVVVNVTHRGGSDLIRSIQALNGC